MATVTLKDLMDPLKKIEVSTRETSQKLDAVIAAVTGGTGSSLNTEIIAELKTQTGLLRTAISGLSSAGTQDVINELKKHGNLLEIIVTNSKKASLIGDSKNIDNDKLKEGANAIRLLGGGAASLAAGLLAFMFVPKGTVHKFTTMIKDIMVVFNDVDEKRISSSAKAFEMITDSIGKFAKNLALASVLLVPGMVGVYLLAALIKLLIPTFLLISDSESKIEKGSGVLSMIGVSLIKFAKGLVLAAIGSAIGVLFTPVIVLSMLLIGSAFALLGLVDKPIKRGVDSIDNMGKGLIWFSLGLVTFALSTMFILIQPSIIPVMVGTLILMGGAFALLGVFDKSIRKGSSALFLLSVSLVSFSIGYLVFSLVTSNITLEQVGIQAGILLGVGLAVGLIGLAWGSVIKGSIAIAGMGLGLFVFGLGYLPFALVTKNMTMDDIGIQLGILLGLGLEFAAAGAGSPFILAGAAAFAAVGVSLLLLAPGLKAIRDVNFTEEDSMNLATSLSGIKAAFLGTDGKNEGFFSKIGGVLTGAIDSVRMIEAAAAFMAAGVSLKTLSWGLASFKKIGWSNDLSLELGLMLSGITAAFSQAGGEPANPGGIFGAIFGNTFSPNSTKRGIDSVSNAGKALTGITKGLMSFQDLIVKNVKFGQPDQNGNYEDGTLGYAVTNTLGFIRSAFAAVGGDGNVQGGGFFNTLFDIKRNRVEEGVRSVMGVGKALKDIVTGISSFQTISSSVKFGSPDKDGKYQEGTLGYAITNTVGFISSAFASIAEEGNVQAGGFFNTLLGIKKNKVAEGISSVSNVGNVLDKIVNGLISFQSLVDREIDWDKLGSAVSKSLGFVSDAFASIGGKETTDGWFVFSWNENQVKKGIKNVKGAGTELINVANSLKTYQELVTGQVDFNVLGKAIKMSLTIIGDAFAIIGGKETKDSAFFGLIQWDENLVKKGIDNVKGAGAELSNIAKGLQAFSELSKPDAIANSIKSLFTSIGDTFTFYYDKPKFTSQLDHMKGFITEISNNAKNGYLDKAAKGIGDIATAVNSIDTLKAEAFASLFKGAGELTDNKAAFNALLEAVENIREALNKNTVNTTQSANNVNTGAPNNDSKVLTPVLNSINASLNRLNGTMSSLPAQIQSIKIIIPE